MTAIQLCMSSQYNLLISVLVLEASVPHRLLPFNSISKMSFLELTVTLSTPLRLISCCGELYPFNLPFHALAHQDLVQ